MNLYFSSIASCVAALLIAYIMNATGCFKKTIYTLLLASEGNCLKFYFSILAFTVLSVCVFNNLYVVLIFLPVLYEILVDSEFGDRLIIIFLYSCLIIGEIASVCSVNGNINNLLYSEKYYIDFNQFVSNMFLIGIIGTIVCTCFLYIIFRNELRFCFTTEKLKNPDDMIEDWSLFNIEIFVLLMVIIGCFLSSFLNYNYSIVIITGALLLYLIYLLKGHSKLKISANKIILIIFVLIFAAFNLVSNIDSDKSHLLNIGSSSLNIITAKSVYGFIQMIFSWVLNSTVVSIGGTFLVDRINASFADKEQIIYLSILLSNIGSILSPIGSISIIIFFKSLKKVKLKMKFDDYIKMSVKTVMPALCIIILIFFIFR